MNNALKYSNANNAILSTKIQERKFFITFEDDGKGFNADTVKSGYGLKNMQNRASQINGHVDILSDTKNGTKVQFMMKT